MGASVATAPPVAVPVSVPVVAAPADPVETAAPSSSPADSGGQGSVSTPAPAPASPAPALPIVSSLPCALTNLSKVLQQPAAGGAATPAGVTPGSGNLLSELLSPVNSLSPVLACDPTLARVAGVVKALSGQKPAGVPPPKAGPTAPAPQGLDLFALLQQLLGLTPSAPSPH
jgi:hypothetical protein